MSQQSLLLGSDLHPQASPSKPTSQPGAPGPAHSRLLQPHINGACQLGSPSRGTGTPACPLFAGLRGTAGRGVGRVVVTAKTQVLVPGKQGPFPFTVFEFQKQQVQGVGGRGGTFVYLNPTHCISRLIVKPGPAQGTVPPIHPSSICSQLPPPPVGPPNTL